MENIYNYTKSTNVSSLNMPFILYPSQGILMSLPRFTGSLEKNTALGIFNSKCPQNSGISDKMSASTACSFFQVCVKPNLGYVRLSCGWVGVLTIIFCWVAELKSIEEGEGCSIGGTLMGIIE